MKKKVLIVGNGPSSTYLEAGKLVKGAEVVRMNWFFMEKKLIFTNRIDYLILNMFEPILIFLQIRLYLQKKIYHIKNLIAANRNSNLFSHFVFRDLNPNLVEFLHLDNFEKLKPTMGIKVITHFMRKGYEEIRVCGIDFYQGNFVYKYLYSSNILKYSAFSKRLKIKKHLNPPLNPYRKGIFHSIEKDIACLKSYLKKYPKTKLVIFSMNKDTTKIWKKLGKNIKIIQMKKQEKKQSKLHDPYLEKKWLREEVKEFKKRYGLKFYALYYTDRFIKRFIKRINIGIPLILRKFLTPAISEKIIKFFREIYESLFIEKMKIQKKKRKSKMENSNHKKP